VTSVVDRVGALTAIPWSGGAGTTLATGVVPDSGSFGFAKDGAHIFFQKPSLLDRATFQGHLVPPTLYVAPATGGTATALLGRVTGPTLWANGNTLVIQRAGTPKPYSFQDGLYVATLH